MSDVVLAAIIGAVVALFTATGALLGSWYATRTTAKLSELEQLRDRVDELSRDYSKLFRENIQLWEYILRLRIVLQENGLPVPPLPEMNDEKKMEVVRGVLVERT